VKDDEKYFIKRILKECSKDENNNFRPTYKTPREIINEPNFPINPKRALYLLDKWSGKGLYDYGVALDLGWLEPAGVEIANNIYLEF
jgi:hypothetical protein